MRQWQPDGPEFDADEVYRDIDWDGPGGRLALGMVVGLDGGVTIDGRAGDVGGDADKAAFRALRDAADVIMVGAGTARAEGYGPVVRRPDATARRSARSQAPVARLVVVTRSLTLSADDRMFGDVDNPPLIVTSRSAPEEQARQLRAAGATVWQLGEDEVDLVAMRDGLVSEGMTRILCEGGPSLNTTLLQAGLVDELFVTVAPVITGSPRHLIGPGLAQPVPMRLLGAIHAGSELLLRYAVDR